MIKHLELAKDKVMLLLQKYPVTRDDDKLLWLAYLVEYHGLRKELGEQAYLKFKEILMNKDTCVMESISRCRRKIQETGLFQGDLRSKRLEEAENVRNMMR